MTHATPHNMNTPRRVHPAVVRAALRSRNTHRFEYDKLDRMVKETRPLGQTIVYAYDANGNLTQVTDPKGQIKKYTYDNANRRTREDHYAAGNTTTPVKTVTYTYNTLDRLTGYSSTSSPQAGTTIATYTYDAKQLRQTGESINYGGFSLATTTNYNTLGQKTAVTYPDGATYNYTFDANNQLSTVGLPTGFGSITINSYLWTVPSRITLPGGTVRTQQYDGLLRLKDIGVKDPGQSQVMNYQYGYGLTGNIVSKATEQGSTAYSYDTLDRLTGAAYTGQATAQANETYTYDLVANRTSSAQTANWTYNANNQLTAAGSITYTYDANGNTLSQTDSANQNNTRSYIYDTDNRLIEVHDANNAIVAVYSYDPFGRRLSKDTGNSKTYYFYDDEGLIAEADATGQITRSYGYAPGSTFSTNPLFTKVGNAYYTYQNDHLGTPQKLLNQSGVTVWSATYDAYGNATVDPNSTVTNNLRFPGQYYDAETGLHYNWNRYYDPTVGRYITSDPIGLEGGVNLYAYVEGNSIVWFDSEGLVKLGPKVPKKNNNPELIFVAACIEACLDEGSVTVTATTNGHTKGSHVKGMGVDIVVPGGKKNANSATCCALKCASENGYVQDEYHYPSPKSTGGHLHIQLTPGKGGATGTGSKPKPKCKNDNNECPVR